MTDFFRVAIESSAIPFVLFEAVRDSANRVVDFRWSYVNRAAASVLKRSVDDLTGRRVEEVLPGTWDAAPGMFELYVRVTETGLPEELDHHYGMHGIEGWFHLVVTQFGDGIFLWFADISAYRRAVRDALSAQQHLLTVTEQMPSGVTRCTADLRYAWVSQRYAEWLSRPAEQIIGRPIREVLGDAAFDALLPYFKKVLDGERVDYEQEVQISTGRRWIHASYAPSPDAQGGIDGWVAVVTDVTERKLLELKLIEADRRKDEFLAVLAHELRNPLAPLRNGLQILRQDPSPSAVQQKTVAMMDRQLNHVVRLVDDLLDVSRIARGKVELRASPVRLADVLAASVESCRSLFEARGQELVVELGDLRAIVHGDFERLTQVFANLLGNGAKYTARGGRIRVQVVQTDAEVVVHIIDTGIGIERPNLEKIFDLFYQLHSEEARHEPGLGVGLSLVRGIVTMHGGRVSANSNGLGTGSTFTVTLPVIGGGDVQTDPGSLPRRQIGKLRILVVDDNADAAGSLEMLLQLDGHHVAIAASADEALEKIPGFAPELIFMDVGMPRMDGFEAAKRIRASAGGANIFIAALTGFGQPHDQQRSLDAGMDIHLVKPIDPAALDKTLNHCVKLREACA